jgi:hypothetical protein
MRDRVCLLLWSHGGRDDLRPYFGLALRIEWVKLYRTPVLFILPGKRIIKGRPFEVGLIVRINAYNKERPHE